MDYTKLLRVHPGAPAVSVEVRSLRAYELKALKEAVEAQRETLEEAMAAYVDTKLHFM